MVPYVIKLLWRRTPGWRPFNEKTKQSSILEKKQEKYKNSNFIYCRSKGLKLRPGPVYPFNRREYLLGREAFYLHLTLLIRLKLKQPLKNQKIVLEVSNYSIIVLENYVQERDNLMTRKMLG